MGNSIEWIGKVPNGWNLNRIQNCIQEVKIKNNPIQTTQVLSLVKDKGVLLYENKGNQGNKAKEDVSEYKLAYPNTMIVNSMNILIGAVGISDYFGCVSPVYYVFKEKDNSDIRFINYIFNTREFQKELRKYANGILEIRLRVSAADIFKRLIALPSKAEQHRIADFLDMKCNEIDGLIEDIEEQICILEDYKRAVITETMFSEECDCTKLKYVGSFQNGMNFTSKVSDNEIPFLGVGDFQNNMVLSGREAFSSITLLLRNGKVQAKYKDDLKKKMLYFSNVEIIEPTGIKWSSIRFQRNNQTYRMLVSICQLIIEGMLITTDSGDYRLASFVDEQRMCRLYEKFILEYYSRHYPELSVSASQIPWSLDDGIGTMLPVMQSDIHLQRGNTVLIIDAKYYSHTTQSQFDKHTIHSNNLYQIFTYVKNRSYQFGEEKNTVSGMLLYAKTEEEIQPDNVYQMHGSQISVKTLDLNQPFAEIANQMDRIVESHFSGLTKTY